jgi:hypothetical protein
MPWAAIRDTATGERKTPSGEIRQQILRRLLGRIRRERLFQHNLDALPEGTFAGFRIPR